MALWSLCLVNTFGTPHTLYSSSSYPCTVSANKIFYSPFCCLFPQVSYQLNTVPYLENSVSVSPGQHQLFHLTSHNSFLWHPSPVYHSIPLKESISSHCHHAICCSSNFLQSLTLLLPHLEFSCFQVVHFPFPLISSFVLKTAPGQALLLVLILHQPSLHQPSLHHPILHRLLPVPVVFFMGECLLLLPSAPVLPLPSIP